MTRGKKQGDLISSLMKLHKFTFKHLEPFQISKMEGFAEIANG